MKFLMPTSLAFLLLTTAASAATAPLPAQILFSPDEHYHVGIEKFDLPGSTAHLFEYGGKVTITRNGKHNQ